MKSSSCQLLPDLGTNFGAVSLYCVVLSCIAEERCGRLCWEGVVVEERRQQKWRLKKGRWIKNRVAGLCFERTVAR